MLGIARLRQAHIGLALVGLMWVFPFLYYRHQYPLTTFDQEWWSALLGMLAVAFTMLPNPRYWQPQIPRIVQLPAALVVLVLLQSAMGLIAYFDQALLYILYLLFALLLMMLGAHLKESLGFEKLAVILAVFLLVGAELNAAIGVLQHFHWRTPLDTVIVRAYATVYGNLAQANHFADYIALGLISLGLLFELRKIHVAGLVLLVLPLLFVMTLSASRSSWLYFAAMSILAWRSGAAMLLRYCLFVLAGFVLMHGIVQLPFLAGGLTTWQRFTGEDASGGIRLYLWHEAWLIFKHSPWLGAGLGQFAWQHFLLGPALHRTNITGLYNNAHNLIFQMAAETGIAGLTVLFVALFAWFNGLRRVAMSAAHWWAYAVLAVLGVHSLLEYPLWYSYFLAIAAILLGALDETRYRLRAASPVLMAAILLTGMLALHQLYIGYREIKSVLADAPTAGVERTYDDLVSMHDKFILSPWADYFASSYIQVDAEHLNEKIAFNDKVVRFMPVAQAAYLQAYLLAQDGRMGQAKRMFEEALWSYPDNGEEQKQLIKLADKDPAHFASLLEFANRTEQEYASAIHNK